MNYIFEKKQITCKNRPTNFQQIISGIQVVSKEFSVKFPEKILWNRMGSTVQIDSVRGAG